MVPEPLITVSESGERAVANINELRGYVESAARNENGAGTAEIRSGLRLLKASVDNNICMLRKAGRGENRKVISALASVSGAIDEQLFRMRAEAVCADAAKGRRQEMLALYREVSEPLGVFAESVWNSPAFYEKRWDNKSANVNVCRGEIAKKVRGIVDDITNILESADESSPALIDRYLETLSLSGLADYSERLREISGMSDDFMSGASAAEEPLEEPVGYKVIKINGTAKRVRAMLDQLSMMGAGTRLVEDGMPRDPAPHALPDFDDFVAVDIETSGSLGTSLGDGRPEITEIGAVKVRGGKITDRFSELCNPGRSIVPVVAELTGITDEMVADKPPVSEVMRRFTEFAGNDILVGHGIANSDIPFLRRAAARAGVRFENRYFDTFRYAESLRGEFLSDSLRLGPLAQRLGVVQSREHRALDDAACAAGVYFALRELPTKSQDDR